MDQGAQRQCQRLEHLHHGGLVALLPVAQCQQAHHLTVVAQRDAGEALQLGDAGRIGVLARVVDRVVGAHHGVVRHDVAEQVVELGEQHAFDGVPVALLPVVAGRVPAQVRDGGHAQGRLAIRGLLADADEAEAAFGQLQQGLEDVLARRGQALVLQKGALRGVDQRQQLLLAAAQLLGCLGFGDVDERAHDARRAPQVVA